MKANRLNMPLRILTFAMVFLGVVSIVLTGYFPPPQPLIVIAVLLIGFFFWDSRIHTVRPASRSDRGALGPSDLAEAPRRTFRHRVYSAAWYIVTLLFLVWCSYDVFIKPLPGEEITVRIPIAAMRLSIFLQLFKVYNAKSDRDYIHMFLLSFFQFVSCAGVCVEFYLLPLLLLYMIIAMWALTLFHFRRQLRTPEALVAAPVVAPNRRAGSGRLLTPGFFTGTFLASLLVIILAAALFLAFPRSATSDTPLSFQRFLGSLGRRLSSGSSGTVDLNIVGIINRDPRRVLRASFPTLQDPPYPVLWRHTALHYYDGRTKRWGRPRRHYASTTRKPSPEVAARVNVLVRKSPGLFVAASEFHKYNSIEDLRNDPQLVPQQYAYLYSYARTRICSAFTAPVAVIADVPVISSYVNDSHYCWQRTKNGFNCTVFSRIPSPASASPTGADSMQASYHLNQEKRNRYTELPPGLSPRFHQLAKQVTRGAPSDYEKARALRTYLSMNCRYSLKLTQAPGRRGPLYDFLFADKPGHCEYFASAMVILLRELGIPSCFAHGYSTGRWDPETKVFEVRRLDAHAWAEVFIENRGWIPFDPTPTVPDDDRPDTFLSNLFGPFSDFFRACEDQWAEGVISYNRFRQKAAFRFVLARANKILRSVKEFTLSSASALSQLFERTVKNTFLAVLIAVVTAVLLLAIVGGIIRFKREGKFRLLYRRYQVPRLSGLRVKFYEKMLRLLVVRGIAKDPADTPLEFADRVASAEQPLPDVRTVTDLYYFVRFGNGKLTYEQSRTIQAILARLRRFPNHSVRLNP